MDVAIPIALILLCIVALCWLLVRARHEIAKPLLEEKDLTFEEKKTMLAYVRQHKACKGTGRAGYYAEQPVKGIPYRCHCIEDALKRIEKARRKDVKLTNQTKESYEGIRDYRFPK